MLRIIRFIGLTWAWALLAVAVGACDSGDTTTGLMLIVDADDMVRSRASVLELRIRGEKAGDVNELEPLLFGDVDDASPIEWPHRVALVPQDGDPDRTVRAHILVREEEGSTALVEARVVTGYVRGQRVSLRVVLDAQCIGVSCNPEETCRRGECVDAAGAWQDEPNGDAGVPLCTDLSCSGRGTCDDSSGAAVCTCDSPYGGASCELVDECAHDLDDCEQVCVRLDDGFLCNCEPGFQLAVDGRSCDDVDECALDVDGCEHACENTEGSYECSCDEGYRLDEDGHGCNDVDECAEGLDDCEQVCVNTVGSFECDCDPDYHLGLDGASCFFQQVSFEHTGEPQVFVVPAGVTKLDVELWGAEGGRTESASSPGPGRGGYVGAEITVAPGEELTIVVGGRGTTTTPGYNGGGASGVAGLTRGGCGGGASDLRRFGSDLSQRILVAGGGGGAGHPYHQGGHGGPEEGQGGQGANGGGGGTQTAGGAGGTSAVNGFAGSLGQGGASGDASHHTGGGGGGGFYGGGGGGGLTGGGDAGAGGGGSSFAVHAAANVEMTRGVREGDGFAVIRW
jgi:hypothetical protein